MGRNITDELAEWVGKQQATKRQDAKAVAFLAIRSDVVTALDAGYSMKTVWAFLKDQGRITSSYEAFRRHVQKHIRTQAKPVEPPPQPGRGQADKATGKPTAPAAVQTSPEPQKTQGGNQGGIGKFSFNAEPDKERLI